MNEEDFDTESDISAKSKSGSKKGIIFAFVGLILVGGGGTAAYMSGMLNDETELEKLKIDDVAETKFALFSVQEFYYHLPTMITNLSGNSDRPSFLKFSVSLEVNDVAVLSQIQRLEPRVIDILQVHFRELRLDDLRDSRGIPILRHEILKRINAAIRPAEISSVLLNELLIQ